MEIFELMINSGTDMCFGAEDLFIGALETDFSFKSSMHRNIFAHNNSCMKLEGSFEYNTYIYKEYQGVHIL